MNILQITAGAAGMYCGSCTRDNALARELLSRGHDAMLVPVYTPTRPDEPNVSRERVLFGGISVYLQQYSALFRHTPRLLDRLWDSPRVIRALAGRAISTDARLLGDLTVSMLRGEDGVLRKEFEKLVDWVSHEPAPDVIDLPNTLLIAMAAPLKRVFGRPVCCTMQGEELFLGGLVQPYRDRALALIREQAATIDRFIAVSDYCAGFMQKLLQVDPARISVVPLGITMEGYEPAEAGPHDAGPHDAGPHDAGPHDAGPHDAGPHENNVGAGFSRPFTIGYFARVAPEKGLHVLADAYVRFRRRTPDAPARLDVAGYLAPAAQSYLDEVRARLAREGLAGEFAYRGAVDRAGKLAFLRGLDVLSVPATYDEPKGLFVLEAMASGVPVVQPRRGGFTEIVERTGGGLLVAPDDPERLADGLHALWSDPARRAELAGRAFRGVREHYTVSRSADRLLAVYESVITCSKSRTSPSSTPLRAAR